MLNFTQLYGAAAAGGAGAVLGPVLSINCFASRTWTAPQDGIVLIRAVGAGGGGATHATAATGGYSGAWGTKIVRVAKGASVAVTIGAGGAGGSSSNGAAGGNTTVMVGGITYTANGGPSGILNPTAAPANGPSPSSNWDFGASSVHPAWKAGSSYVAGAAMDFLSNGAGALRFPASEVIAAGDWRLAATRAILAFQEHTPSRGEEQQAASVQAADLGRGLATQAAQAAQAATATPTSNSLQTWAFKPTNVSAPKKKEITMPIIEILDADGQVANTVVADAEFAQAAYPDQWRFAEPQPEAPEAEPAPTPAATQLTRLQFRNRFTLAEKAAIEFAALDNPSAALEQRQQAALLRACLADQAAAEFIDLLDTTTLDGVQLLVQAGLLTEQRGQEVLALP